MPKASHSLDSSTGAEKNFDAQLNSKLADESISTRLLASLGTGDASKPARTMTKAAVVVEGTLTGLVTHGVSEAANNPGRFGAEILGATALTVAMKGPSWVKLPALGVVAVGTYAFGAHALESGLKAASITQNMTEGNLAESRAAISETLGPLAFDSLLMVGSGYAGTKLAGVLPKRLPTVSFEMSPQLAFEGGAMATSGPRLRFDYAPESVGAKDNIMAMSNSHDGTGGGSSSKHIQKDGYKIVSSRGSRGEDVQLVDQMPAMKPVELLHGDHSISNIRANGKVTIGFPTGEARMFDLGKPIKRVTVSEYAGGQKQYRLNETALPNMEVNNLNHEVKAVLANGDKLHMVDNVPDGHMNFNHQDGLKSWVEYSGRLVFQLPNGVLTEAVIPSKIANIKLTERLDGSKLFEFLSPEGTVLPQKVELPSTAAKAKSFDEISQWRDLKNYLAGRPNTSGTSHGFELHRVEPDAGGAIHQQQSHKESFPFWNPKLRSQSTERAMAQHVAGVDPRTMRGNDLETPADMMLAQQGHSWITKRYLDGLDRQDSPYGNH